MKNFLLILIMVNDPAERGIKLLTDYKDNCKDEKNRECLGQVVEQHRSLVRSSCNADDGEPVHNTGITSAPSRVPLTGPIYSSCGSRVPTTSEKVTVLFPVFTGTVISGPKTSLSKVTCFLVSQAFCRF